MADIAQLVGQHYCRSQRATARAIAALDPSLDEAGQRTEVERLRKNREFLAAHEAIKRSLLAGLNQPCDEDDDTDEPETCNLEPVTLPSEIVTPHLPPPTSPPAEPLPPSAPGLVYERPIAVVLEEKIQRVQARVAAHEEHRVTRWELKQCLPLAIVHLGDPHVDNPGCRLDLLKKHVTLIQQAREAKLNVVAGNIGDSLDNWVGRLQSIYADSHTTYLEGVQLVAWLLTAVPEWLYIICGNHDNWQRGDLLIKSLCDGRGVKTHTTPSAEARVEIVFGNGKTFRLLARHDFKRRSMYHVTHGGLAAGREDPWCDLSVAGHLHSWGETNYEDRLGKVRGTIRVRGYKVMDAYALENGFHDDENGHAIVTVVDPLAPDSQRFANYRDVGYGLQQLRLLHDLRTREY